jgi:acyl transferase domain-containing protein/enoyl-CoA hydratase/carnithine racemase/acyl carrier protein/SAM-dependent methyltransferase
MLEMLNRYAHGLSSIPVLHALRERGCLARLAGAVPVSVEDLAREFSGNRGYLDVAVRMLVSLEWIRPLGDGRYEATAELTNANLIPERIMDLYGFPFDEYVRGGGGEVLEVWLRLSERRWNSEHPFLPDYLDGLLIIPLLLALRAQGRLSVVEEMLHVDGDADLRSAVERLFVTKGWGTRSGEALHVNRAGRFVIDRIFVTATVASYKPMFQQAQKLLFGDAASVFGRDSAGHELHVDRTVNVIGSGFQHEKFFAALSDLMVRTFDTDDFASQPKYIADMGCGDGTLLRRLYEVVRDRTRRGKVLDAHPLIPVGADFNEKALVETSRTLAGIVHMTVKGDIGDPAALLETLRENGVEDLHRVLHVRSFLDHDRPYRQPEDRAAAERRPQAGANVYISSDGQLIPAGDMVQSTVEHLRRWSKIVNEHGLVLLEVHCLPPDVTARYRDESENFHFDVYHALSHQFLLDAKSFLACAAEAGLFWREGRGVGFPKHLPYKRISLNLFERRPYLVREALAEDLPALAELQHVWTSGEANAVSGNVFRSEFVLESEGRVLASVLCHGQQSVRLTAVSARRGTPASHLRDLLQFVEQYWALTDAGPVIGIDDCRSALPRDAEEASVVRAVARDVQARVAGYPFVTGNDPRAAERELATFSFRWLLANLQQMGVMLEPGEAYELDALVQRLGVAPKYHEYFDALMRRLQDEGLVAIAGRRIETTPLVRGYALTSIDEEVAEFTQQFQQRYPANLGLLNLTARGLGRFEEIVTGRIDITDVIFQDANMDVFTEIFRGGAVSDYFNRIVADAVRETVVRLATGASKVRIVEIGAGTGATTAAILDALQSHSGSVEFCFSDISQSFLRNAKRRFAERYPWVEYRLLNIEEDLAAQGFEAHRFDIVVAANVLHDTRSVDRALDGARKLLKAGGLLVLDEYTSFKDCLFFSGALLHGYWLFQDPDKRLRDSCLLGVPQWIDALERTGFTVAGAHALPTQTLDATCGQSVMLCEAKGADETEELRSHGHDAKPAIIGAFVERQVLTLLGDERASGYAARRPVMDMGLDSLELVELKSLLERGLGVKLTPMFLFEHETTEKMASALSGMVSEEKLRTLSPPASAPAQERLPQERPLRDPAPKAVDQGSSLGKAEVIESFVEQQVLALLGETRGSAYSAQRPVMDMGLDSLELVELKSLLERGLLVKLTPMFLFEHETPEKLTAALSKIVADEHVQRLAPPSPAPDPVRERPTAREAAIVLPSARKEKNDAIAIVGVACRFPGGADSPSRFWKLLESGRSGIVPMPAGRWRWPAFIELAGKHRGIDRAGFLDRIDEFDAAFFRTSPKEANLMDPQQRLLLELSWEAIEDAGHRSSELSGRNIGVFTGVCHYDYREVVSTAVDSSDAYVGTGNALSLLANRLSFFYDFKGPSLTVDTACSSSLVALHHAINAIRRGDCEQALVGAANLLCSPTNSISYYRAGMLSPSGSCRTFDAAADGYVRGEGGAMLLLKPLAMALAEGDAIYGLVKGTAVNHGGQAASLTAPKPEAQAAVIEAAWQAADTTLDSIGYIEAHGTGTRLGDPVEIGGLIEAFGRLYRDRGQEWPGTRHCALGSVKPAIGHLEGAAGLAGLIKVLLSMQHRSIPATLNLERLNPDIDLADSPFYVVGEHEVWPARRDEQGRELPRSAGVSSFGFGGANAHAVIEEHRSAKPDVAAQDGLYVVPLSARNSERLVEQGKRLLDFLIASVSGGHHASAPRLVDIAYTLQAGREPMEERVAFVVGSREELMAALHTWLGGDSTFPNCYRGQLDPRHGRAGASPEGERRHEVEASIANNDLAKLASFWANGAAIEWARLAAAGKARRTHLPTYPFAKERYWIETAPADTVIGGRAASTPVLGVFHPLMHPLLHANSSNLSQQSYSATFSGEEFFLSDHQVRADGVNVQKVLPGVAYLEMARAAIDHALPGRAEGTVLELRNTAWVQPIVVSGIGKKQVNIALVGNDNDSIDFDFYSQDMEQEIVHCQGQAALSLQPPPEPLDIEMLRVRMTEGRLEPVSVYVACARKGLVYGPSFQGMTAIHQGNDELLADLRLPKTVEDTSDDYVLHPSLMDGALQAAFVLIETGVESDQPRLPFSLESLRIVARCTREMVAWVRFASGSRAGDNVVKLDIDLCDSRGNVCAAMRGLSLRAPSREPVQKNVQPAATECLLAAPAWQASVAEGVAVEYAAHHVILCELPRVNVEKLQSLITGSECLSLHLGSQKTIAHRYSEYAVASFERIQRILQSKPHGTVLIQLVVADDQEQAVLAGLSGLLKTATLENPQVVGQVILARPETTAEELARELADEKNHRLEPLVKYEDRVRRVWRWQEVVADADKPYVAFKDHGVYLITGGLGGLGVLFAREILERTRLARVVLTGRSGLTSEKQALLDGLSSQQGRVTYRPVDLEDLDQVKRLVTAIRDEYQQLNGILHSAGMTADEFILKKARTEFAEVLGPKVTGTYNLDKASRDIELDFFVLFSSIVGPMGNIGQADYAAANGFLDHFAAYRNRLVAAGHRRGRTRSINWPLWQAGGMSMDAATRERLQEATGMHPMQTVTGMQAFHRCLALPYDEILVMEGDSAQIRRALLAAPGVPEAKTEQPVAAIEIEQKALAEQTQKYLRKQFSGILKLPTHKIDPQAALREYGIDSILGMQLIDELEQTFGSLSKTLFFEYQTIREVAEYLGAHHSPRLNALFAATANRAADAAPAAAPSRALATRTTVSRRRFVDRRSTVAAPVTESEPIAIVGLSGRYPEAIDVEAYWENLRDGKDCIVEVPKDRWDWHAYFADDRSTSGRHYSKWGGFISGVDEFDPLFFGISPREAEYMDPQERLFLQYAWIAVEDAGYSRAALQIPADQDLPGQVGVYVGVMWSEYQLLGAHSSIPDRKMGFAGNVASIANRVSYVLNLHGPSVTLDTMCSSSLSAIHFACQDLKLGRTSMAIAGGVNVTVHPNKYLMLSVGQFISSDGHCQSFGEGGDGYIPGEGVGAVVLKRLSDARRDRDHIYGVIRSSALNHGGRTNGYTVPNPQAQASAIRRALAEGRTDARHVSYIEAHGTGTKLGDPIEIAALSKVFGQYTQDTGFCLIGSAKSNIGHCESAAGVAGLTKVLLQMEHQQIVPSLHSAQLNPHIDFTKSPFTVNQSLRPWEPPVVDGRTLPRVAGISSFGAGGSNAHMIIEEYVPSVREPVTLASVVVALSARTPEQLHDKARDLLAFVRSRRNSVDLIAMAYTLQVGRDAMEERLALVVSSVDQLTEKLQAFVAGTEEIDDAYRGAVKRNKEALSLFSADDLQLTIDHWIATRKLGKLAELWARGMDLDWNKLYAEARPHRISLPVYPFARERYWIQTAASQTAASTGAASSVLHPLLHSNTSDLEEQRYRSTFAGEEFFLADHQVAANGQPGEKILPAVAYLEMVRAAMEHASPAHSERAALELRDVVWAQPVVVTGTTHVSIALSAHEGGVDFEIFSRHLDDETVHCQGRATFEPPASATIDLEQLEREMTQGRMEPDRLYDACTRMGLLYGPAFRAVTGIERGDGQLLARLRIPASIVSTSAEYVLHPSVMDGALQASVALMNDSAGLPRVPFALESLRVLAPCAAEMVAWVRYTPGGQNLLKLDVDLCDGRGNVCAQFRGLSLRPLTTGSLNGSLIAVPVWEVRAADPATIAFSEHHVISMQSTENKTIAERYSEDALACFERLQAILQSRPQGNVLVQLVVHDDDEGVLLSGLSALLKTAALENPQLVGQVVLVPPQTTPEELTVYLRDERALGLDPVVRYNRGVRQVLGWQEVAPEPVAPPVAFKDHGVYLITGGLGGLGILFAKEALEHARHTRVVLTGRAPLRADQQALLDGISADRLTYRQIDLADRDQVTHVIASIREEYGRLDGILHSAGMIADNFILKKTAAEFKEVLTPKVTGTFHLDEASKDIELDFFVLFSSFAGAMGNLGQSDYAAANGFLDQFAAYRNRRVASGQRHGRTRSINWPLWQAGRMTLDRTSLELLQQSTGMHPMKTTTGTAAFHRGVASPYDQILVVEGDLAKLRRTLAGGKPKAVARPAASQTPAVDIDPGSLMEKTQEYFQRQFSDLLKVTARKIDPEAPLEQYGIDSVLSMQLIGRLELTFGSLSRTLLFEYQSIRELSEYFIANHTAQLSALLVPASTPGVSPAEVVVHATPIASRRFRRERSAAPATATQTDPIAIIGLSGRYPEAIDLDAYWTNLRDGKDCIVEVPKDRWDWKAYFSEDRTKRGRHYSKWGGFIAGVDEFDPLFFNIAPKEAKYIDPQERLFLQHTWMAIEDAGYNRAGLQVPSEHDQAGQVGVYVGVMWSEYHLYGADGSAEDLGMGFAGSLASIANRVSYALNLHGPSMTLDTMCSSSLTAIHLACQDLKQGRTSLAIAGGVNVSVHPNKYLVLSTGQFISSDGHCQSFGEGGDGYIPGEGVGVVVLKRLSEARRDGDHIYGVIRGSALNHGGKTNGYTVPNPHAQGGAISRALSDARVDARHISYIEAHGTGTKLGDPIEIAALGKAFDPYTKDSGFCLLGSAKSNIGHCESAAGIAGLTKVLLQMQHQQIVPSLHSEQLNPHIDFARSPFTVNQALRTWEPPVIDGRKLPRIAGISSFGAGGSNAHMIVEEYQAPMQQPVAIGTAVILLSARTADQLQQKARDLFDFVRPRLDTIDLASIAYTLQVGRDPMEERLGIVVSSVEQLIEKLEAFLAGRDSVEGIYRGQVKRNKEALSAFTVDADLQETVDKWVANRKHARLLDLWVKGLDLDWSRVYGEIRPGRISLPTYPFARERHWIDATPSRRTAATGATASVLHPLLHSNTSDLTEQRFRSTFAGDELFVVEQNGEKVLSAGASLEMARAAIERAMPERPESALLEIQHTAWAQPIVVGEGRHVTIALSSDGDEQIEYEIYSNEYGHEIVHCQGRAVWTRAAAPGRLDLEQLKKQGEELLPLRANHSDDFVLHPSVLDGALKAAGGSDGSPSTLQQLRIVSRCTPEMVAWVRSSPGSGTADSISVDIDLCDERGNVAVEMRGVRWEQVLTAAAEALPVQPAPFIAPVLTRREITFLTPAPLVAPPVERNKRTGISLSAPSAGASPVAASAGRPRIALSNTANNTPASGTATSGVSPVRLYDCASGIFSLEIAASRSKEIVRDVLQALEWLQRDASLKTLMLSGVEHCFGRGGRDEYNDALARKLFERLVSFAYPVIAVLHGDVIGAGFLAAALCDFLVCSEDAHYAYTDAQNHFYPTPGETILFSERFGDVRARDFLYGSAYTTGRQLRAEGWTCPVLPWPQVGAHAEQLASTLATKSQDALRLLKAHLTGALVARVEALTPVEAPHAAADEYGSAERVLVVRYGAEGLSDEIATRAAGYKAIVLVLEGDDISGVLDQQRLILDSEIPVIAALPANLRGNAWLVAQFCDAAVYARNGSYSAAGISRDLAQTAVAGFAERLGAEPASEILLTGGEYSGVELQQRVGALTVADSDQVLPVAMQIAESWARMPRATLTQWKGASATILRDRIRNLPSASAWEHDDTTFAAPPPIALRSRVVTLTRHPEGIVVVKMEDREARNMFSEALVEGVREAFGAIAQAPDCKVVILTGYDSYFASGGTKESLLAIQEGKVKFTDFNVFHLALECKVPVIAAIQGHGLGAGWSMGMFADIALLSEESRYVSPYMNYGFTPGAGATYSLPDKLGPDVARESLLTAQQYAGHELKDRGVKLRILPRSEVLAAAMTLARQTARSSRGRLIALKQQLTAHVRPALEETYERELAMHEKTFVGRSDTLAEIEKNFYREVEAPSLVQSPAVAAASPATAMATNEVLPAVVATLRTLLASELQIAESDLDENAQFIDLGLDSITGVTWIRKINQQYQTSIEATKVYSYPTLTQLGRHVRDEAEKQGTLPVPATSAPVFVPPVPSLAKVSPRPAAEKLTSRRRRTAARTVSTPAAAPAAGAIAVIGMAGQFPQARNLDEFWQNIAEGRNCITEVPRGRWDVSAFYQPGEAAEGKTNSQWMGALEEFDRFDPLFFNISPAEAENMDPQQRLFLQACWHSVENAGYDARVLSGSRCGVFVGCGTSDYHQLSRRHQLSAQGFTGGASSILAARISYWLNLQGPCLSIDTACSSSLVAIAQACDSLTSGVTDLALAGGVYVMAGPEMHIKTAQAGMLSAEGKCFAFDQRADGFVPGEGVGVVMLKRLSDAERDQDIIYGVIQGWGVNQDGKTNGITAPNPESQTRLEQEVYEKYQIDPAGIQLIEAHGTGTKLGDPIEVEGLRKAFARFTRKAEYCALGSVKSNIGHCLTAAGIAGVLKLILALKHRQLPPTINFERLNEHIELEGSPFYVNTRLQEWKADGGAKRQAAISSFGFSGTNAHLVVGEYLPPAGAIRSVSAAPSGGPVVIPLSARTAEQLTQKARDLMDFLRTDGHAADLNEIACTLQIGRVPMDERVGFVVTSLEQLVEKLRAYANGEKGIADAYQGQVRRSKESLSILTQDAEVRDTIVNKWMAQRNLPKLLNLWVKGLDLDWSRFYGEATPRRISLPIYPFARERYWIEATDETPAGGGIAAGRQHPLLQRNTSDLRTEHRYTSTFTGDEPFLADHRVRTDGRDVQKILPGVAYLEMAQAAIRRAWPLQFESSVLELQETVWLKPVIVDGETEVSITLFAAGDDRVEYEVHSGQPGQLTVHCQGQAAFRPRSVPGRLELDQLRRQFTEGTLEGAEIYGMFAAMGLHYGPAHQGITSLRLGANQLLAELRLPASVKTGRNDYVLHPSLMDSALQASIGLLVDRNHVPGRPAVPFAVESVQIFSPCTEEMSAWVRYSGASKPGDLKLDVDLCDALGNVCVQLRAFALRVIDGEGRPAAAVVRDEPRLFIKKESFFDGVFYERLIADVLNGEVSVDEATELG